MGLIKEAARWRKGWLTMRKRALEADLAALDSEEASRGAVTKKAAAFLRNLPDVWAKATPEERRTLVAAMVEAVWCNLDKNRVEAIQFKDFLYPLRAAFPPTLAWCGTDGIQSVPNIGGTPCPFSSRAA